MEVKVPDCRSVYKSANHRQSDTTVSIESPSPARPVPSTCLGTRVVTVVSSPETLTTGWDVLLDLHVGVSKPDNHNRVTVLYTHRRLLRSTWGTPRLVQGLALTSRGDSEVTAVVHKCFGVDVTK